MPVYAPNILLGSVAAAAVAVAAVRLRALTLSGAAAAWVIGTLVFGIGGLVFSVPLIAFFVSSSAISRLRSERKQTAEQAYARVGARGGWQVLANGGIPTAIVCAAALTRPSAIPTTRDWFLLYLCAIALANADTWATELGALTRATPRLITSWKAVPAGASGGITTMGTLASLAGALLIPLSAWAVWPHQSTFLLWRIDPAETLAVTWAGFMAALLDSVLGGSVQAQFRCAVCRRIVEVKTHCARATTRVRGMTWMGNDVVNLISSLASVAAGWYLLRTFAWPTG